MGTSVWSAFKFLLWTLVALHALVTFLAWFLTLRTLGIASLRHCGRMLLLSSRGWPVQEKLLLLTAPFVVVRFLNGLGIGSPTFNVFPLNALTLLGLMLISLPLIPPTAVVF
jgi:hypothetical protein